MKPVGVANQEISILEVCSMLGMSIGNAKNYCPFGPVSHADGGAAPAFRVYVDTNSAYCFACGKAWRPVSLLADARDLNADEAAATLLEAAGYVEPDIDERLEGLLVEEAPKVDTDSLAHALATFCARTHPNWKNLQYDDEVATHYRHCLELLDLVHTPENADVWLTATKRKMTETLERYP